jgi:hypothetical protein
MKTFRNVLLFAAVVFTLTLMGCRTAPVYNVENAPVEISPTSTVKDVKRAIISAGAGLGWQMNEESPGHIVGTLILRKHMAKVDISYSKTSYSIIYKDSAELSYDGSTIHSNYNGWIQNLDRAIKNSLSTY